MWLIDEWGMERFQAAIADHLGHPLTPAAAKDEIDWDKRDHLGVHPQLQPGFSFVGLHIPVGRLDAAAMFELARLAEVYGNGEIRWTVEQNVILPFIANENLPMFLAEPLLERFRLEPTPLTRSLVSCTGAQFCNFALVETKQRAVAIAQTLDQRLDIPHRIRIHWTGCPNSCGQPQVADIGLMGTKVRKDGKTVEGVDIYMGGTVGKDAQLGTCVQKGIACDDLIAVLESLMIEKLGATPKAPAP